MSGGRSPETAKDANTDAIYVNGPRTSSVNGPEDTPEMAVCIILSYLPCSFYRLLVLILRLDFLGDT